MRYEDVKPGQKVRVTRAAPHYEEDENGRVWRNSWEPKMNPAIGNVYEVESISFAGVELKGEPSKHCSYPWSVLELVEDAVKFKVGQMAKVIRPDQCCMPYAKLATKLGLSRFKYNVGLEGCENEIFKVLASEVEERRTVVAIENVRTGQQYLVVCCWAGKRA